MPHYSTFWDKHYEDIGNCCMTEPLDETVPGTNGSRIYSYIDVGWMNQKKLKWIGVDKQGYCAWITPDGMIYNFKDLKRNEKGEKYEKEVEKLELPNDGSVPSDYPTGRDLYEWEMMVQEKCGFCRKDSSNNSGKDIETDSDAGREPSENSNTSNWRDYANGNADPTGVTNNDYVKDPQKYVDQSDPKGGPEGKDKNPYLPPLPYAPPVPLPTNIPPYTPQPVNPVLITPVLNSREDVRTPATSPFQKMKNKPQPTPPAFKWDGNGKGLGTPASVGTYGVTPTVNPVKQQPIQKPQETNSSKGTLSDNGIELLKNYEKFEPFLYNDEGGNATIGYGHLVHYGKVGTNSSAEKPFTKGITKADATSLLKQDLSEREKAVTNLVKVPLSQNKFDALVLFQFNTNGLDGSTLLKRINNNSSPKEIEEAFKMWNKVKNKTTGKLEPSNGLTKRRIDEAGLYNSGDYSRN